MKILIVTQYFYPEDFRINDFAFILAKRGHDVTVLTGLPNYPGGKFFGSFKLFSKEIVNDVCVYRVPIFPRGKSRGWELFINYMSFLFSSVIFGPFLLRRKKLDVVFAVNFSPATVGLSGAIFAAYKKAKFGVWIQDLWPDSLEATKAISSKVLLNLVSRMVTWIYFRADTIFVQSTGFVDSIKNKGISRQKIEYFPNWAEDIYGTHDAQLVYDHLIPKNKFILMFAGNLGVAQSLETIIQAAILIKNEPIHWIILGSGRAEAAFKANISKYNLESNISLLGKFPVSTMPHFFALADVMVVTLKDDPVFSYTIPSKIQSYLKSSKPILSALNGEGAEVINNSGAGINVPSEDYKELAFAALSLSKLTPSELSDMGISGKEFYDKHFDVSMLVDKFEVWATSSHEDII